MAVVLSSEENSYFASSTLQRSHSQPKFVTGHSGFHTSSSASRLGDLYQPSDAKPSESVSSSAPSSPRAVPMVSAGLSWNPAPSSSFSLYDDLDLGLDGHIILPQYDDASYFNQAEDLEPPPSPRTGDSFTASPNEQDTSTSTSRPGSPEPQGRAADDIALQPQPSRQVDYLSHNWREEEVWSSWKHVTSRRGNYTNAARLENASWRSWMKAKNKLKTISPETLNWLKDCDVTWLYGPLQTGKASLDPSYNKSKDAILSDANSFISKKPILKKRSMSEIMLRRSLSASSLVRQAAAAVQAQQMENRRLGKRPVLERSNTDYMTFPFSQRESRETTSRMPSAASSGLVSPGGERKHIHFNEQVEQCIAVDIKSDEDDEMEIDPFGYDSEEDDGAIMMKRSSYKKKQTSRKRPRDSGPGSGSGESRTIAMLPSTTLKYRVDTPEPFESALKHSTGAGIGGYKSPLISPSPSQETLRPPKRSVRLFNFDDDDGEEDEYDDLTLRREPSIFGIDSSSSSAASHGLRRSVSTGSLQTDAAGNMRRTSSGMLMPYDEGSSPLPLATDSGIFNRVIDTVNTARDIAHVIWNVGWRR